MIELVLEVYWLSCNFYRLMILRDKILSKLQILFYRSVNNSHNSFYKLRT